MRFSDVSLGFPLNTIETNGDYYLSKWYLAVALELPKELRTRIFGN